MPKDCYYFQHDYNARNDDKILELRALFGPTGYGIFWMLIETIVENENSGINKKYATGLSISYGIAKAELIKIIDCCLSLGLLYEENGNIMSKRILGHVEFRKKQTEERSQSGRRGGLNSWINRSSAKAQLNGSQSSAKANLSKVKESKVKESKEVSTITTTAIGSDVVVAAARFAWNDKKWREQTCMAHYLNEDDLRLWMAQYNASICNDSFPNGFDERRYMKMFGGWMNKQREKGHQIPKKPITGKSQLTTLKNGI